MTRTLTFTALAVLLASAACLMSYCKDGATTRNITNTHRQIVGDLYDPGTGRIQIRDTSRRIVGYVERSGRITNTRRRELKSLVFPVD